MRGFWLFRHAGLKVLSVLLAVLLWIVVSGDETVERGLRVPLELQQFPDGLELAGQPPTQVDVRVRGASGTLSRVSAGDIVAVLDLRGAHPGQRLFHLTPDQVRAPIGVEVVQVTPATVPMTFERTIARVVPVAPPFVDGKPAEGYAVGAITLNPASVEVVGAESAFTADTRAVTEPMSVDGAVRPVREVVTIGTRDPALRLKTPRSAIVTVDIEPVAERVFHEVSVHLRTLASKANATVEPGAVDIKVKGSHEMLTSLDLADVTAWVDLAGLGVGDHAVSVHAESARAEIASVVPSTIQVRIASAK
jgi:YbbR domain-containing protein